MAVAPKSLSDSVFPAELVDAVTLEGEGDADFVGRYLRTLGFTSGRDKSIQLSKKFLLFLATALRLLDWEKQGFFSEVDLGLLKAIDVYRLARQSLTDPNLDPTELRLRVNSLFVERFAWSARRDLDADITVAEVNAETLLETVADFLWALRPH